MRIVTVCPSRKYMHPEMLSSSQPLKSLQDGPPVARQSMISQ